MNDGIEVEQIDRFFDRLDERAKREETFSSFLVFALEQIAVLTSADSAEFFVCPRLRLSPSSDGFAEQDDSIAWMPMHVVGQSRSNLKLGWLAEASRAGCFSDAESLQCNVERLESGITDVATIHAELGAGLEFFALVLSFEGAVATSIRASLVSIVEAVAEACRDCFERIERETRARDDNLFDLIIAQIHGASNIDELARVITHDCTEFLHVDRAALLIDKPGDGRWKLLSISGTDDFVRNAEAVVALEEFMNLNSRDQLQLVSSKGLVSHGASGPGSVGKIRPAEKVNGVNATPSEDVLLVPLPKSGSEDVSIFFQWSSAGALSRGLSSAYRVLPHVVNSLGRCHAEQRKMFGGMPSLAMLRRVWIPLTSAVIVLFAILVGSTIEADFYVDAVGIIEPVQQRAVFATHDGFVDEIYVEDGASVDSGEILLRLKSPDLERQRLRLDGEMAAIRERRDGFLAAISQVDSVDARTAISSRQMSAEVQSLDERLLGYAKQRDVVLGEVARLELRSPIDGSVVANDAQQNLINRPVNRGDKLFRIASFSGDWHLKLWVADQDVGHLREAVESQPNVMVSFKLISRPSEELQGNLVSIGETVQPRQGMGPAVSVEFEVERDIVDDAQMGATVYGRIECGRRSWWYVWGRELVESFQRRFWVFGE
ncbi:MAG: efflux RND transporter periplasmic adaptor subunit [Planctomycetota bacterium]